MDKNLERSSKSDGIRLMFSCQNYTMKFLIASTKESEEPLWTSQAAVCMGTPAGSGKAGRTGGGTGAGFCVDFFCGSFDRHWSVLWDLIGPGRQEAPGTQLLAEAPAEPTAPNHVDDRASHPTCDRTAHPACHRSYRTGHRTGDGASHGAAHRAPTGGTGGGHGAARDRSPGIRWGVCSHWLHIAQQQSTEYLTWEDYAALSRWELVLARNEIFARHGRRFQNQDIQAYFDSCSWYEGTIAPEDFDTSVMNDVEVQNVWTLKAAEG